MQIRGARILLTGASSGIGEALAYELARRGGELTLVARRESLLESVKRKCASPEAHRVLPLDLTDYHGAASAIAQEAQQHGMFDIVIHNAGISQRSFAEETLVTVDETLMAVNYFAPVAITKALLPEMLARRSGQIVVVSSVAGKIATPYRSGYSAAKHAIIGFMDALRAEVHDRGVIVTNLMPGFIATGLSLRALTGDGAPLNQLDDAQKNGLDPGETARRMVNAIERGADEVAIAGWRERSALWLQRISPAILRRVIRKAKVR